MKKSISTLCLLMIAAIVIAQPNYEIKTYSVEMGKNEGYYHREAEREIKSGNVDVGLLNAAYGLQIAEKKKDISNSQEQLRLAFANQKRDNLAKLESLKAETATFQNDETVAKLAEIVNIYTIMYQYNDILRSLPVEKFAGAKKNDPNLSLELDDFSSNVGTAKTAFEKGKRDAAQMHYDKGLANMSDPADKKANRQAARHFRYSYTYISQFSDAEQKYREARELGIVKVGVTQFGNKAYTCDDAGGTIALGIASKLTQSDYEFVEVTGRDQMTSALGTYMSVSDLQMNLSKSEDFAKKLNVDYVVVGTIESCDFNTGIADAGKQTHTKNIVIRTDTVKDSDGKDTKKEVRGDVSATAFYKKLFAKSSVGSSYNVIEVQGGGMKRAGQQMGTNTWEEKWRYSYSGDSRALPSERTNPPKDPGKGQIINESYSDLIDKLFSDLENFVKTETEEE